MDSRKLFLLFFVFFMIQLPGQEVEQDTIYELHNIEVIDTRAKEYSIGYKIDELDKKLIQNYEGNSVADVLSAASGVNIKTDGPGGLSGISVRGGSSAHTAVMWNGINLQSPMNGGVNLSLLPIDLFSDVSLQYGGSGSLAGSGAAFGVLRISSSSNLSKENSAFISTGIGSYSNYRVAAGTNFHISNSLFSFKSFYQESENDFEFVNTSKFGFPTEKQTNSAFRQYGFVLDNKTKFTDNLVLIASLLYQEYDKDVPTLMSNYIPNEANTNDKNTMLSTTLKYNFNNVKINFKNVYLDFKNDFSDPNGVFVKRAINSSKSFVSETDLNIETYENRYVYVAANYTYEEAVSDEYDEKSKRNKATLIGAYRLLNIWNKVNAAISLREEIVNAKFTPIQASVGVDGNLSNSLDFNFNLSRVYRIPTFNDLYWTDTGFTVGNPNLKDESGYSTDFGLIQKIKLNVFDIKLSQTVFLNYINNLIVWNQQEDGKWKPLNENIGKAKGVELGAKVSFPVSASIISVNENYSYTIAETLNNTSNNWQFQVYTPKHNLNSLFRWDYKKLYSTLFINYYSKRYIDKAGKSLDAYAIGDFNIGYSFDFNGLKIDLSGKINNIWNTQYQVSSGYAMPLRNFMLSAKFIIN
ncbi:MAG: TonB-dependent receptor [Bacteroidota bacterium]